MLNEVVLNLQQVCAAPMYQRVVTVCSELFGKATAPGVTELQKQQILNQMCSSVIDIVGQPNWARALEIAQIQIAAEAKGMKAPAQAAAARKYPPSPTTSKVLCPLRPFT